MFWENIRTLYYLIKYNNIKTTGFFLKIHSSTITRRIKQLEKNFNKKLFYDYKNLILSDFGNKIIEYFYNSCNNLEKLESKNFNIEKLYENNKFVIYLTDVYYYNVLIYLYEKNILCRNFFNIRYISIINHEILENLINMHNENFIYITGDSQLFENYNDYISIPLCEIPIFFYENNCNNICLNNNFSINYSGNEKWLKDLYKTYNFENKNITTSNSIHILSKLIYCANKGILPETYTKLNNSSFKKTKISKFQLMLIFHKNNIVVQKFFVSNNIKNN